MSFVARYRPSPLEHAAGEFSFVLVAGPPGQDPHQLRYTARGAFGVPYFRFRFCLLGSLRVRPVFPRSGLRRGIVSEIAEAGGIFLQAGRSSCCPNIQLVALEVAVVGPSYDWRHE